MVLGSVLTAVLKVFAYCSGHIILGSLCSVLYYHLGSFAMAVYAAVWSPDSWKCTYYRSWFVDVQTNRSLRTFTYHRGRLVVGNPEGVLTGTYRCGHGSWKCTYRCL